MKNKLLKNDFALIAAIFVIALAAAVFGRAIGRAGDMVEVRVKGEVYAILPLDKPAELDIGGLCVLKTENGDAWIESAVCKNQICVKHRPVSRVGEAIVCLPSGVTVKITGEGGADIVI